MFLPLSLLFVGAVLVLNSLWMAGRISDKEITVINFATGAITASAAVVTMIRADHLADVRGVALTLLFSITYLWVAVNRLNDADGRGLGWFSLFVSVSVIPEAYITFANAGHWFDIWMGINWIAWSGLWFLFFLNLAMSAPLHRPTTIATFGAGVFTAWVPALVLMYGIVA